MVLFASSLQCAFLTVVRAVDYPFKEPRVGPRRETVVAHPVRAGARVRKWSLNWGASLAPASPDSGRQGGFFLGCTCTFMESCTRIYQLNFLRMKIEGQETVHLLSPFFFSSRNYRVLADEIFHASSPHRPNFPTDSWTKSRFDTTNGHNGPTGRGQNSSKKQRAAVTIRPSLSKKKWRTRRNAVDGRIADVLFFTLYFFESNTVTCLIKCSFNGDVARGAYEDSNENIVDMVCRVDRSYTDIHPGVFLQSKLRVQQPKRAP